MDLIRLFRLYPIINTSAQFVFDTDVLPVTIGVSGAIAHEMGEHEMDLNNQHRFMQLFHSACLALMESKGPDYAPDGIPLLDLATAAAECNISIPHALWPLYRKHFSAIRKHFLLGQPLTSEPVEKRLQDAVNFFGLLAFYETHKRELHTAWRQYWEKQRCECVYEDVFGGMHSDLCTKCECMRWLERQAFQLASGPISSRSTRKARG